MNKITLSPSMSIQEAVDNAPNDQPLQLELAAGSYREKIWIKRSNVTIIGAGEKESVLVFSDYNHKVHADGKIYNTFRTPTLTVTGDDVLFQNVRIVNDAGFGPNIGQAVALAVYGNQCRFHHCAIEGYQDTVFLGPLPRDLTLRYQDFLSPELLHQNPVNVLFSESVITGSVDYIFGSATALFLDCQLVSRLPGFIAAPSTYEENPIGLVFWHCQVDNLSGTPIVLARPWREHGSVLFQNCQYTGEIHPDRYDDWEKKTYRFFENPLCSPSMSRSLSGERMNRIRKRLEETFHLNLLD